MLTVKNSITRSLTIIISSSLMIWLALEALIPNNGKEPLGWFLLIFFAVTFIKGFYHLADRQTKILVDKTGIYFPGKKRGFISWSEVKEIEFRRDNYQDSVLIELKNGIPLRLKMFPLNASPEELLEQVSKLKLDFSGPPKPPEQPVKALPAQIRASDPESDPEMILTEILGDDEEHINEIADETELSINHLYITSIDSNEDEKDFLSSRSSLPAFFSDDKVTNEIVWISIISIGVTACLFIFAHFDSMGPPKISWAAQLIVILGAGIIGPVFYVFRSFLRNDSFYGSFSGKSSIYKASLKVKAKKKSESKKSDRPDGSPGKKRMKKERFCGK